MTNFPEHIDEGAPVVVRLGTEIAAPVDRVWRVHTDVNRWTEWQSEITSAVADAPLAPGVDFRWSTHGLDIVSTVYVFEPPHRIVWGGPAQGIVGIHEWVFEQVGDTTVVRTEESWDGEPVRSDVAGLTKALTASLQEWLNLLKATAERAG
jgi:uncharacterized protein YndB with AHSA1/START domain